MSSRFAGTLSAGMPAAYGRVHNRVLSTRPWPDTTARHRHALSPHVVTSTVIRPSCSTHTVGTPIPITKIATATTAAVGPTDTVAGAAVIISAGNITHAVAANGRIHNEIVPTRTGPEMTARHHHALSMLVIVSAVIRPSHGFRHTRTVGTSVPRNNAATSVSTNHRRLSAVIRQPPAPSVATTAKATVAPKITGE